MKDADKIRSDLRAVAGIMTSSLGIMALGLTFAAASLTGGLATACSGLAFAAVGAGIVAIAFAPSRSVLEEWEESERRYEEWHEASLETPAKPQQAIDLQVDAPTTGRRWQERVERSTEAEAAGHGR
jgi:hypothetical protein